MQHALLGVVSTWRGRQVTQSALEERGFSLPRKWQETMIDFCGPECAVALNRYWDEVAAEVVCSAGKVNPDARKFLIEPGYRSSYLDELATKRDFGEPPYRFPPLLKCLYEYVRKSHRDRAFLDRQTSYFESLKDGEIAKFSISSVGLTGRKTDIIPFVEKFSSARGFNAQGLRFVRKAPAGLVFEIKVDIGGIPEMGAGLPIQFYIYHESDPDFAYESTLFDMIVPGFSKYEYCPSPDSCVLGILAHVEMFDVLSHSFPGAAFG
jgi:hypothetical protein